MKIEITQRSGRHGHAADSIKLDHMQREKGRFKTVSSKGHEVCLFLERGKLLGENEILESNCGYELSVSYAEEAVMTAFAESWPQFCEICYHMGNRHVRLQIGNLWIRFKPDHVLQELAELYSLEVKEHESVFIPELGAYRGGHKHSQTF